MSRNWHETFKELIVWSGWKIKSRCWNFNCLWLNEEWFGIISPGSWLIFASQGKTPITASITSTARTLSLPCKTLPWPRTLPSPAANITSVCNRTRMPINSSLRCGRTALASRTRDQLWAVCTIYSLESYNQLSDYSDYHSVVSLSCYFLTKRTGEPPVTSGWLKRPRTPSRLLSSTRSP